MIDLANLELWFVAWKPVPLRARSTERRRAAFYRHRGRSFRIGADPREDRVQASDDQQRLHSSVMPGREWLEELCRTDPMDAHVLSGPDVDRRPPGAEQTVPASPHAI